MTDWTDEKLIDDITVRLVASENGIREILLHWSEPAPKDARRNPSNPLLRESKRQLQSYFAGELRQFNLPLDLCGTDFQLRVWRQLLKIPYGETRSYSEIAQAIQSPAAVRAVGAANGANPISIVVPCHRVIGSSGKLVGYGGGLPMKKRLLALERGSLF
jgi:methylated-DNA-[protein]-cysteine S-methyltransferase